MRKSLLIVAFILPFSLFAQESINYNYKGGQTNTFTISSNEYYIEFSNVNWQQTLRLISPAQIIALGNNAVKITLNLPGANFEERKNGLSNLLRSQFRRIEPVLIFADSTREICTGQVIVKLTDTAHIENIFAAYNIAVTPDEFVARQYFVDLKSLSTRQIFTLLNTLTNNKSVQFAEPNFIRFLKPFTNDPYYNSQWAIKNQGYLGGTPGADMHVENAWNYVTGQGIKVAIIDEGVDLNHPDLAANLLPGYDATGNGSNGAPSGNDAHGTSCAGIVAAIANNNIGVSGIAYNAKVLPVRIAKSSSTDPWTNDSWAAGGITWAKNNGADVLSNSWGGGSPSTTITHAINDAVTNGRSGKGCVVLFSTGNSNTSIAYPSTLSNVIAVGACSMCDTRKTPTSCDGETWWGGNYGAGLDVMAPGVQIYTTDISGSAGYNAGDYKSDFNGTSSACPNAAAVIALILSVNPNLTAQQARDILETTCDKVGGYTYQSNISGQPNGTWCADAGYGRVNACAAVSKAFQSSLTITGPKQFCSSGNYSVNAPTGTTLTWSASPASAVSFSSTNTNPTTVSISGTGGSVTLTASVSNGCYNSTVLKNITVGPYPLSSYSIAGAATVYASAGYHYTLTPPVGIIPANIFWRVPAGWSILGGQGTYDLHIWTGSSGGQVQCNFDNACGEPTGIFKTVIIGTGGPAPESTTPEFSKLNTDLQLTVTPNPANNIALVSIKNKNTAVKENNNAIVQIKITDKTGNLKKQYRFSNRSAGQQINISSLQADTYFVQAYTGSEWLSCKLIIIN